ncbi:cobaltochelatase subunit CobN [Methanococcoides methylutens]|uniref:cobaltochelatase subunit CobN n=1 Tax=Methanococcoides methylutens TaxID=2226 RepID=UPI00404471A2
MPKTERNLLILSVLLILSFAPVASAEGITTELVANTISDSEGNYDFPYLADGNYTVVSYKYVPYISSWTMGQANITVEDGQDISENDLYLTTIPTEDVSEVSCLVGASTISGNILSNTPFGAVNVSDASVVIRKEQYFQSKIISDGNGSYNFSNLANGNYTVIAYKYVPYISSWTMGQVNITIVDGQDISENDIYLTAVAEDDVADISDLFGNSSVCGKVLSNTPFGTVNVSDATVLVLKQIAEQNPDEPVIPNVNENPEIAFVVMGAENVYLARNGVDGMDVNVTVFGSYRMPTVSVNYTTIPEDTDFSQYDTIFLGSSPWSFDENAKAQIVSMVLEGAREDAYIIDLSGFGVGNVDLTDHPYISLYWEDPHEENVKRLVDYMCVTFFNTEGIIQPPLEIPEEGIYHPDSGIIFENVTAYLEWYANDSNTHHVYNPENTTIGVIFFEDRTGHTGDEVIDDVIRRLEADGVNVIPAYTPAVLYENTTTYFYKDGEWLVDAFIDCGHGVWRIPSLIKDTTYLQEIGVPVINAVIYEGSYDEWKNSTTGSDFNWEYKIPIMEIGGQIESIVVGAQFYDENYDVMVEKPIPVQMEWMINRTLNWIKLQELDNQDKKVAIIYYDHSPGKQDTMTASNLDVAPSLANLLEAMNESGYDLDNTSLNKTQITELVLQQGRNIGYWAPGELEKMVENHDVELLPMSVYEEWFNELPEKARQEVTDTWGPAPGIGMVYENESGQYFVFPKISMGNVLLAPQPSRSGSMNETMLYHDQTTPPGHHYIAFYLWLNKEYEADAIVHFGRHGTQEWLKGKGVGLSVEECWPAIMIQDMPVVYLYDVGGIGEGIMAKRRGNAVMVDHSTPPIVSSGLYGNLSVLHQKMHLYSETEEASLKQQYRGTIIDIYGELNFDEDLNISTETLASMNETQFDDFVVDGPLHDYLHELADEFMPYGMHIMGEPMLEEGKVAMVKSMLGEEFTEHLSQVYEDEHALDNAHSPNLLDQLLTEVLINGSSPEYAMENILNISGSVTIEYIGTSTSDEYGDYTFSDLSDGDYKVIALKYVPFISSWSMAEASFSMEDSQNMSLPAIYMESASDEDANAVLSLMGNATASGKILSSTPYGVVNTTDATVMIKQNSVLQRSMSDEYGDYSFTDLPEGEYTVVAMKYVPFISSWSMGEVTLIVEDDQHVSLPDIYMESSSDEDANAVLSLMGNATASGKILSSTPYGVVNTTDATIVIVKEYSELPVDAELVLDDLNLAIEFAESIDGCMIEIPRVLDALDGRYIPPALGDDPIRSPRVLPTGRNFYGFNPYIVPTEEAWNVGKDLADDFLNQWVEEKGEYPRKLGFVLWSSETMRHKGVMESEIFYLLGVEPQWDRFGNMEGVKLIDSNELGRPRIDVVVTMSGIYRDNWKSQVWFIDRAVRMAAQANDTAGYPNYVMEDSMSIYDSLMATGNYTEKEARALSMTRVFGPPEGMWGIGGLISATQATGTWEDEDKLADLYIGSMSNPYGEDVWGGQEVDAFRHALDGTEAVMFSRSGNDNRGGGSVIFDHVFEFFGGMGMAVRDISGTTPEMYIVNLRNPDPNAATTETLSQFLIRDLRAKYYNPKWIEGMMGNEYAGAREMSSMLEDFWGLEVMLPEHVTDDMWNEMYEVYVQDKYELGLDEYFNKENPWARQSMTATMLEAARKGYWDASDEILQSLTQEYVESVVENGVTCCHHTCGNPLLDEYVKGIMSVPGVVSEDVAENYSKLMNETTQRDIQTSSASTEKDHSSGGSGTAKVVESGSGNQTHTMDVGYGTDVEQSPQSSSNSDSGSNYVEGYEMTRESVQDESGGMSFSGADMMATLLVLLSLGAVYLGFVKRKI